MDFRIGLAEKKKNTNKFKLFPHFELPARNWIDVKLGISVDWFQTHVWCFRFDFFFTRSFRGYN